MQIIQKECKKAENGLSSKMGRKKCNIVLMKLIGDKKFYRMVLAVAVPIMIQNGITNFVNLLDNIMVGRMGTEEMSGVSIVNQLLLVYNLCIFGGFSGAGIFTAQYYGIRDDNGIRQTCTFKLKLGALLCLAAFVIFGLFSRQLIGLYLNEGSEGNLAKTLECGLEYIKIMMFGLPFFMIVQALSSTLRECGQTVVPMKAGILAVAVNFIFNWLLIFGKLGFPVMGVRGAAIATVLSRVSEAAVVVIWTIRHKEEYPFAKDIFRTLKVDSSISKKILVKGSPLLINEALWSAGMAFLTQCYSVRGLDSVAGFNICSTVTNLFKTIFLAMGASVGIIVGQLLGAGRNDEAVDTDRKMIAFSVFICIFISAFMLLISSIFPRLYNTNATARAIATNALIVSALCLPNDAFKNATYFTLRSGGRTWVTFFFDSCLLWVISVPLAYFLSRYSTLSSVQIYAVIGISDLSKSVIGFILVKRKVWIRNIVR